MIENIYNDLPVPGSECDCFNQICTPSLPICLSKSGRRRKFSFFFACGYPNGKAEMGRSPFVMKRYAELQVLCYLFASLFWPRNLLLVHD